MLALPSATVSHRCPGTGRYASRRNLPAHYPARILQSQNMAARCPSRRQPAKHTKPVCLITFGQEFHDQRLLERRATRILTFFGSGLSCLGVYLLLVKFYRRLNRKLTGSLYPRPSPDSCGRRNVRATRKMLQAARKCGADENSALSARPEYIGIPVYIHEDFLLLDYGRCIYNFPRFRVTSGYSGPQAAKICSAVRM